MSTVRYPNLERIQMSAIFYLTLISDDSICHDLLL